MTMTFYCFKTPNFARDHPGLVDRGSLSPRDTALRPAEEAEMVASSSAGWDLKLWLEPTRRHGKTGLLMGIGFHGFHGNVIGFYGNIMGILA